MFTIGSEYVKEEKRMERSERKPKNTENKLLERGIKGSR